jgi:hypothetical protein
MADGKQKHTRGIPWADHTEASSAGAANPADKSARIDPEELEGEVSPGSVASSTPASPEVPANDSEDESHPDRDVGKGTLRYEHLKEDHRVD